MSAEYLPIPQPPTGHSEERRLTANLPAPLNTSPGAAPPESDL